MAPDKDREFPSGEMPSNSSEDIEAEVTAPQDPAPAAPDVLPQEPGAEVHPESVPGPASEDQAGQGATVQEADEAAAAVQVAEEGAPSSLDDDEEIPPLQDDDGRAASGPDEGEAATPVRDDEREAPPAQSEGGDTAPLEEVDVGAAPSEDDSGESPPVRDDEGETTSQSQNPVAEQALPAGPSDVMPLMEHLRELRTRLLRGILALLVTTAASFAFTKQVLTFLIAPMGDTLPQALKPTESIGNYMKVALLCGVTLAMPVLVYQIGRFVSPALTKEERRRIRPYLLLLVPGATLFFVGGIAFAYFIMLPTAIPFLQGFLADIIEQQWAIGEYLSFVTSLLFWIGVAFEMPLFVFFLAKTGVIDARMLSRNRKYAILIMAVVSAVITPTVDPVNMLLVMGPLILLYELGILLARLA